MSHSNSSPSTGGDPTSSGLAFDGSASSSGGGSANGNAKIQLLNLGSPPSVAPGDDFKKNIWLNEFNKVHAVLADPAGQIMHIIDHSGDERTVKFVKQSDLSLLYRNRPLVEYQKTDTGTGWKRQVHDRVTAWLRNPNRQAYARIVFNPSNTLMGCYNLWTGFAVEPREGDCSLYWQHLKHVICAGDDKVYEYIRKLLAWRVQNPAQLPMMALILQGAPGSGKGEFVQWFGKLFGQHFFTCHNVERLTGRFNAHLANKLVVFADEATWGGDKQREGVLKAIVTERLLEVEEKFEPMYVVNNYKFLIVASNEDWPVAVGAGDRRFFACQVDDCYCYKPSDSVQDADYKRKYFDLLELQMNSGGLEALLYDLQNENLTGFRPTDRPLMGSTVELKIRGMNHDQKYWFDVLSEGKIGLAVLWEDTEVLAERAAIYDNYKHYCEQLRVQSNQIMTREGFWRSAYRFNLAASKDRIRNGITTNGVRLLPLSKARSEFAAKMGEPLELLFANSAEPEA